MQSIHECPICEGRTFTPYLTCIDHTVSHETFHLVKCQSCDFVITFPMPTHAKLESYYLSDDYISHTRKNSGIFDIIYRISRYYTLQWKVRLVKKHLAESNHPSLLDYGCGTGEFLKKSATSGFAVQGVEPSARARQNAEVLLNKKVSKTINDLTEQRFDAITLWHVLEHIPDLNGIVNQLKTTLKQNGTMFIAVPNHNCYDAQLYQGKWAGYDVPRHLWHFTSTTMNQLLTRHGLQLKEIIPMKLDAFYVSMLSEKYVKGVNGPIQMLNGLKNGIKSNRHAKSNNQYSSLIYVVHK